MRNVILQLAVSLDGYIEGPNGEFDWCFTDGDYGMTAFFNKIDAIFIGRKSYELTLTMGGSVPPGFPVLKEYVFTNSLKNIEGNRAIISGNFLEEVNNIKRQPGKDIWLYGGAELVSFFLNNDLVDEMTLAVHPILLGSGKPLFQQIKQRKKLALSDTTEYPSGLVMLTYKLP